MRDIAINRIMTSDPVTVGPDESVAHAIELLESHGIHHLPVVEDGVLVGIMSSSDLLKLHILREKPAAIAAIRVSQIMESDPVTLDVFADLIDVATKLGQGAFHALPVVEADNVLVGIVTSSDLINHLLMQIPHGDGSLHVAVDPQEENRKLREVCKAAELYMRSGHGEREHAVLLKALEDVRRLRT